ncbi:hypothetical protein ALC57_12602 [Trachymyrmex cornetzi]|uniref:DNA-directed DNA polymerase n=1 Tax=Trachymyrmex cornetzi TaxID=471704 RepID=A0A151J0T4_9HYME|nr:hypothetical protein ALC57_12602 [Trachymyrmex cornetzi]
MSTNIYRSNASIARLARLEGLRNFSRQRFEHVGSGRVESQKIGFSWLEIETAFNNRVLSGVVLNSSYIETQQFLDDARDIVIDRIRDNLQRYNCLKVNTIFNGEFVADAKRSAKCITTKNYELFNTSDLREWYEHVTDNILAALEEFQERDSGWALSRISNLIVNVNKYNSMHEGCWVELRREIMLKKAVINVRSMDNAYFAWSVVAALYPAERNVNRKSSYPDYTTVLNLECIEFPVTLKQITKFEFLNDISINVFIEQESGGKKRNDGNVIVPLRLTREKKEKHVNLLYLQDSRRNDENVIGHSTFIKNLSRLTGSQLSKCTKKKHLCVRCLHYFLTSEKLSLHIVDCTTTNECAIILPNENDKWLSFRGHNKRERLLFVVYADLECILAKKTTDENISRITYQHHKVFSVGYYVRYVYDETMSIYKSYRGEDCVSWFVKELYDLAHRAKTIFDKNIAMAEFTSNKFRNATHCHICERPFEEGDLRVRDHCHLTRRYRGPAHSRCNLQYHDTYVIPVFFHNLAGYDAHFIIKDIANNFVGRVDLLPITKEKYISITKHVKATANSKRGTNRLKLRFVDSFKFLNTTRYVNVKPEFFNRKYLTICGCHAKKIVALLSQISHLAIFVHHRKLRQAFDAILQQFSSSGNRKSMLSANRSFQAQNSTYSTLLQTILLYETCIVVSLKSLLDVRRRYPQSVHDAHVDLPFCPTRERPPGKRNVKLLVTLYNKERYVVYYRNLQQCIHHGLRITKIYRILQFTQSPWLRGYIELNTRFRMLANNEFEKNFYKLMNNAVFGKTMENVRDHVDVRLITRWDGRYGAEAMIAKPNFHSRSIFSENLVAIELRTLEVKMNKPIYVGICILEIAKLRLYEFHYEYIIPLYRDTCKILYTDTDSLIYLLECENLYEDIKRDIARFDTSDYPERKVYDIPRVNNKIPGLMKDENCGVVITEYIALRAKMYALKVIAKSDTKRIKGVKKNAKTITFDDYVRCLNDVTV